VHVAGNLTVGLGDGVDSLFANALAVERSLDIADYAGDGRIALHNTSVGYHAGIHTGTGNNAITLDSVKASVLLLHTGDGADQVQLRNTQVRALLAFLGDGDDSMLMENTNVSAFAFLHGGPGTDKLVGLGGNTFGHIHHMAFEEVIRSAVV
jgi:hypothetical protein